MASAQTVSGAVDSGPLTPTRPRPAISRVLSGSPRTPSFGRSISGAFSSPSAYSREPEEVIVYELTPRYLSAGFSGESKPRCISRFGYSIHENRRVGDFHDITAPIVSPVHLDDDRRYDRFELYRSELRGLNFGLVRDRLERVVRGIHIDYLQLDQKPRKAVLVVSSLTPTKILDIALEVLFSHYTQPPNITLLNRSVMSCVSAGLRNALIVDIGWEETTATVIGEYRVIAERRSVQGGRSLVDALVSLLDKHRPSSEVEGATNFVDAEEIGNRVAWCQSLQASRVANDDQRMIELPIEAGVRGNVPFIGLSKAVEATFFAHAHLGDGQPFDDQELPLHYLILQLLLTLSSDLRLTCLTRIVVTGRYASIPGLRGRLLQELEDLIGTAGWSNVHRPSKAPVKQGVPSSDGRTAATAASTIPSAAKDIHTKGHRPFGSNHDRVYPPLRTADGTAIPVRDIRDAPKDNAYAVRPDWRPLDATDFRVDMVRWLKSKNVYNESTVQPVKEANASSTKDPATEKVDRDLQRKEVKPFDGQLRGVDSLGPWAGASMVASLQVKGVHTVDREDFLKYGYRETMANMI